MNRSRILFVIIVCIVGGSLTAEGGGGVEALQVVGRDGWPFPYGDRLLPATGQIHSVGGFGYGVDDDGFVVGGFGLGISSEEFDLETSAQDASIRGLKAGYGGILRGWQHRWGPIVGLVISRVGFGGARWSSSVAGFSMLGTAEAQLGLLLLPWFNLGVTAGMAGTLTLVSDQPFLVTYAPIVGVRLTWGSF